MRPIRSATQGQISANPYDLIYIFMVLVIAVMMLYVQDHIQAADRSQGKAQQIDRAKGLVTQQLTKSNLEVIQQHSSLFLALTKFLFIAQGINGIGHRCPHRLDDYRQKAQTDSQHTGLEKQQPL